MYDGVPVWAQLVSANFIGSANSFGLTSTNGKGFAATKFLPQLPHASEHATREHVDPPFSIQPLLSAWHTVLPNPR